MEYYTHQYLPDTFHSRDLLSPRIEATAGSSLQRGRLLLSLEGGLGRAGVSDALERLAEEDGISLSASDWEPVLRFSLGLGSR